MEAIGIAFLDMMDNPNNYGLPEGADRTGLSIVSKRLNIDESMQSIAESQWKTYEKMICGGANGLIVFTNSLILENKIMACSPGEQLKIYAIDGTSDSGIEAFPKDKYYENFVDKASPNA